MIMFTVLPIKDFVIYSAVMILIFKHGFFSVANNF